MQIYISEKEVDEMMFEGTGGVCIDCGEIHYDGIEPDAEDYKCDVCGEFKVMGIENALLCGEITTERPRILHDKIKEENKDY